MKLALIVAAAVLVGCAASPRESCDAGLTPEDQAAIRSVMETYRTSWLRGDQQGVLGTFSADAVLLPAHGAPWVTGKAAIIKYWWPSDAAPSSITKLDISIEGLSGGCGVASAHGHDDVGWTTVENGVTKSQGHPGTYLNVFIKQADGAWKIARHMWDDGTP